MDSKDISLLSLTNLNFKFYQLVMG